jgi:hypothetical protein
MSESRDKMIDAIRRVVIPTLRDMGFAGSFPHFRRFGDSQIDLLTVQFNRHGGSFAVEVAYCGQSGITTHWGKHIPVKAARAHDIHPRHRLRLGSHPPQKADHWFYYEPEQPSIYTDTALEALSLIRSQGEDFWRTHTPAMVTDPSWPR